MWLSEAVYLSSDASLKAIALNLELRARAGPVALGGLSEASAALAGTVPPYGGNLGRYWRSQI